MMVVDGSGIRQSLLCIIPISSLRLGWTNHAELTRGLFIKRRHATRHEDVGLAKSLISDRESDRKGRTERGPNAVGNDLQVSARWSTRNQGVGETSSEEGEKADFVPKQRRLADRETTLSRLLLPTHHPNIVFSSMPLSRGPWLGFWVFKVGLRKLYNRRIRQGAEVNMQFEG